jgi:LCP family protein required for cell wall assembly
MSDHINIEAPLERPEVQENSRKISLNWIIFFVFIASLGILIFKALTNPQIKNYLILASDFIKAPTTKVGPQDRVNILIMGVGGKDHAGGDLTDTMILVSVSMTRKNIVTISIPRDIWIPETRAKINSSYHYGGLALAKSTVQEVLGVPVQYGVLLDFSGFKDIVDALGGISVNIDHSFTDTLYPIAGKENDLCNGDKTFKCRYETVTFVQGIQIMNGDTALKFVRSRHAVGDEGTDIAREARQEKVISAIESKVMDPKVFLNPQKDLTIFRVVMSSLETDISDEPGAVIARKIFDARKYVTKYLIPDNLLIVPPTSKQFDNQYVFIPAAGSGRWGDIRKWVTSILN